MSKKQAIIHYFIVMAASLSALLLTTAYAATYNFYFNNTEQGDNSTATPSMDATDGVLPPTASTDASNSQNPKMITAVPVPGADGPNVLEANPVAPTQKNPEHQPALRVGIIYSATKSFYTFPDFDGGYTDTQESPGISLEYFPTKELSLMASLSNPAVGVGTGGRQINGMVNFYPIKALL